MIILKNLKISDEEELGTTEEAEKMWKNFEVSFKTYDL